MWMFAVKVRVYFLSPAAQRQPHPEQLLPEDDVLVLPEAGWWLPAERSVAGPQSSHRPAHSAWAGQAGLHSGLYSQDSWTVQTERRTHHRSGEPISTGPLQIPSGLHRPPVVRQRWLRRRRAETKLQVTSLRSAPQVWFRTCCKHDFLFTNSINKALHEASCEPGSRHTTCCHFYLVLTILWLNISAATACLLSTQPRRFEFVYWSVDFHMEGQYRNWDASKHSAKTWYCTRKAIFQVGSSTSSTLNITLLLPNWTVHIDLLYYRRAVQ